MINTPLLRMMRKRKMLDVDAMGRLRRANESGIILFSCLIMALMMVIVAVLCGNIK